MREIVRRARTWKDLERLVLHVYTHGLAAQRLYERVGFREYGREEDGGEIHMALDLR